MKVLLKIIASLLIVLSILCMNQSYVEASSDLSGGSIIQKAKDFLDRGKGGKIAQSTAERDLKPIGNMLFAIAIMVLLVVGCIMGVKYALKGVDEKANMKEKLVWYVIAAVLIFSAAGVYNVVYDVVTKSTGQ